MVLAAPSAPTGSAGTYAATATRPKLDRNGAALTVAAVYLALGAHWSTMVVD